MEVKLSPVVTDEDVRHLLWLFDRLGSEMLDLAIVTPDSLRTDGQTVLQ
jgi:uncharacterized protein